MGERGSVLHSECERARKMTHVAKTESSKGFKFLREHLFFSTR
jgi:hypothetical protein